MIQSAKPFSKSVDQTPQALSTSRRAFLRGLLATAAMPIALQIPVAETAPSLIRPVLYCNRTIRSYMDIEAVRNSNILLRVEDHVRGPVTTFRGIPIRVVDELSYG